MVIEIDDSKSPLRRMRGDMPALTFYKLKKYCEKHDIDIHYIDNRLSYAENIEHLESVSRGGEAPELIDHSFTTEAPFTHAELKESTIERIKDMASEMGLVVHAKAYVKNLERARKRLERFERLSLRGKLPKVGSLRKVAARIPEASEIPVIQVKHIVVGGKKKRGRAKKKRASKPRKGVPSPSVLKDIESLVHLDMLTDKQLKKRIGQLRATQNALRLDRMPGSYYRGIADPGGVTGRVPKDVFLFTNLPSTLSDFEKEIQRRISLPDPRKLLSDKKLRNQAVALGVMTQVVEARKPKKKRQRLHTSRTSKTPRVLRAPIKNGVRVFSFSDDVWKARAPKRRRRKRR